MGSESEVGMMTLRSMFVKNIDQRIDGVVKASDDKNLRDEIDEYVLTNEIQNSMEMLLDEYNEPGSHHTNGVWISGYFGSGKSHLLKILSHILGDVPEAFADAATMVPREQAVHTLMRKAADAGNNTLEALLRRNLEIPATSLLFNIDSKAQNNNPNALTDAFVRVFNESRGYFGANRYIAKFEHDLDNNGKLEAFKKLFEQKVGKPWEQGRAESQFWEEEISEAFTEATGKPVRDDRLIIADYQAQYRPTIADFADDVNAWLDVQEPNRRILFLVDEVGQFVGGKPERMLNLQTVTEELFSRTNGRAWVFVTSQEDLDKVIEGRTVNQGIDLTKIKGRFDINMRLDSTDAIEVIQKRLLVKTDEARPMIERLFARQQGNLGTLFDFQGEGGAQQFRTNKFGSEDDFVDSYPFMNYEFGLFHNAMRGMSDAGFFEGAHRSVGERSMLSTVSIALMACRSLPFGSIIPFSRFYDGIAGTLQTSANYRINEANSQLPENDDKPLALSLLKALLMVKHVQGFKATVRNLRVLVLGRFDENIPEFENRIRRVLDVLEAGNYVHRNGEFYEYLTNDEQEIEKEIKNVDITDGDIRSFIGEVLGVDILGGGTHRIEYGPQKAPFRYGLTIDGSTIGQTQATVLHLVTPLDGTDVDAKIMQGAGERNVVRIILPDEKTFTNDAVMYLKTSKYVKLNLRNQETSEQRMRIIGEKNTALSMMRRTLKTTLRESIMNAVFAYNGLPLELKSTTAEGRIAEAMGLMIGKYYPNLAMLAGVRYDEKGLGKVLDDAAIPDGETLPGTSDARSKIDAPAQDVLSFIMRSKTVKPTVHAVISHYGEPPYGWPYAAVLACLLHLYGTGQVTLMVDSRKVERTEAVAVLTSTKKQNSIVVEVPKQYDAAKVRRLRRFYGDYFDAPESGLPSDPPAMAAAIRDALSDEAADLRHLRDVNNRFAFTKRLDEVIARLNRAVAHGDQWMLESFITDDEEDGDEQLLDDKDDIVSPIRQILNGAQKTVLSDCMAYLHDNESNFTLAPADVQRKRDDTLTLANDPNLHRGNRINQLKTMVDELRAALDRLIEQERSQALAVIDSVRESIMQSDSYANVDESVRQLVGRRLDEFAGKAGSAKYIADIRQNADVVQQSLYATLMTQLDEALARQHEKTVESRKPDETPATDTSHRSEQPGTGEEAEESQRSGRHVAKTVHDDGASVTSVVRRSVVITTIPVPKPVTALENEHDVDTFLESYRRTLIHAINEGKKILL
ncbi:BREX system P-loop protein BrxC [Bifidobacterium primatium]|nr:BREX system P-loop protein BrxC [Bifidobacterium primatium]